MKKQKDSFIRHYWDRKDLDLRLPWTPKWFKKKKRHVEYVNINEFRDEILKCMKIIYHVVWWDIKKLEENKLLNALFNDLARTDKNLYIRDVTNEFRESKEYKKWYFKERLRLILKKDIKMKDVLNLI